MTHEDRVRKAHEYETTAKELEELFDYEYHYDILLGIASHHNTPAWILDKLSQDESPFLRSVVAGNKFISEETADRLAKDTDSHVRSQLASCAGRKQLRRLYKDKEMCVRSSVAQNWNATEKMLEALLCDESEFVRACVAENPNATESIFRKLMEDSSKSVLKNLALNPSVPLDILVKLVGRDCFIQHVEFKKLTKKRRKEIERDVRYSYSLPRIAIDAETPEDVLQILSEKSDKYVLNALVFNPNVPAEILLKLAFHDDHVVRTLATEKLKILTR